MIVQLKKSYLKSDISIQKLISRQASYRRIFKKACDFLSIPCVFSTLVCRGLIVLNASFPNETEVTHAFCLKLVLRVFRFNSR